MDGSFSKLFRGLKHAIMMTSFFLSGDGDAAGVTAEPEPIVSYPFSRCMIPGLRCRLRPTRKGECHTKKMRMTTTGVGRWLGAPLSFQHVHVTAQS